MVPNRHQGKFSGLDWEKRNLSSLDCSHLILGVQVHIFFCSYGTSYLLGILGYNLFTLNVNGPRQMVGYNDHTWVSRGERLKFIGKAKKVIQI